MARSLLTTVSSEGDLVSDSGSILWSLVNGESLEFEVELDFIDDVRGGYEYEAVLIEGNNDGGGSVPSEIMPGGSFKTLHVRIPQFRNSSGNSTNTICSWSSSIAYNYEDLVRYSYQEDTNSPTVTKYYKLLYGTGYMSELPPNEDPDRWTEVNLRTLYIQFPANLLQEVPKSRYMGTWQQGRNYYTGDIVQDTENYEAIYQYQKFADDCGGSSVPGNLPDMYQRFEARTDQRVLRWVPTRAYSAGNVVKYDNKYYHCLISGVYSSGSSPFNPYAAYNESYTYPKDALVSQSGKCYKSKVANNKSQALTNTAYWTSVNNPFEELEGVLTYSIWDANTEYTVNSYVLYDNKYYRARTDNVGHNPIEHPESWWNCSYVGNKEAIPWTAGYYYINEVVYYNGEYWKAKATFDSSEEPNTTDWTVTTNPVPVGSRVNYLRVGSEIAYFRRIKGNSSVLSPWMEYRYGASDLVQVKSDENPTPGVHWHILNKDSYRVPEQWDASTVYGRGAVVKYADKLYARINAGSSSAVPSEDSTNWIQMKPVPSYHDIPEWNANIAYTEGNLVKIANSKEYQSSDRVYVRVKPVITTTVLDSMMLADGTAVAEAYSDTEAAHIILDPLNYTGAMYDKDGNKIEYVNTINEEVEYEGKVGVKDSNSPDSTAGAAYWVPINYTSNNNAVSFSVEDILPNGVYKNLPVGSQVAASGKAWSVWPSVGKPVYGFLELRVTERSNSVYPRSWKPVRGMVQIIFSPTKEVETNYAFLSLT